ncbi:OPT oligopeptide transporter protein-domain-containing protein [Trametes punicea]|nr:OPT oligopeptide transporter protein-domain-containing protein [Trametes punicea]
MASPDGVEQLPQLTAADSRGFRASESFDEKAGHDKLEKHLSSDSSLAHKGEPDGKAEYDQEDDVEYVNGEPVITTGMDVSRFLIYLFKPVQVTVSTVFLLLLIYSVGIAWAKYLPRAEWVEGTRLARLAPALRFINPGEFRIKEVPCYRFSGGSTASGGSSAVMNFAVQRCTLRSYGLVGLLRPLTVYPSEMVYWGLHRHVCPGGLALVHLPLLNGINVICLATQHVPSGAQDVITNLFGGTDGNEGLGFLSLSLDWQYITSTFMSYPSSSKVCLLRSADISFISHIAAAANSWIGYAVCYIAIMGIYYSNVWNSKAFPMLSTSLYSQNGSTYDQDAVFGSTFQLNETALEIVGLPALTGSNAWSNLCSNLAIGGLVAHTVLFWGRYVWDSFKQAKEKTQPDPHWQIVNKNYEEVPWYWYLALLVLAFFAGERVLRRLDAEKQRTDACGRLDSYFQRSDHAPWYAYIVALLLGAFVTPFSTLLFARMGNGIATNQLMKMVAGAVNPGKPVANLYFSMWSHDVVATSINLAGDLKIGQYLKVPPRHMFLTQVWGTILGAAVNYVVMVSVVDAQREILLDPRGTNIWSGQYPQSLNSAAVTWSLAKQLYGPHGPYIWIPLALLFAWSRRMRTESIILPIIYQYAQWMSSGTNSPVMSGIIVGLYNFILGGALDGGAQVMIFILSFAVFGASGTPKPFPAWWGNPAQGNVDYCNGNGALD